MGPNIAIVIDSESMEDVDSPLDFRLLMSQLKDRGAHVDVSVVPRFTAEDYAEGWPSIFLGNLSFADYDRVIGIDECGLLVRYPGSVAWLSRLPFQQARSDPSERYSSRLAHMQSTLIRGFLDQGGRLWAASGYLAGRVSAVSDRHCDALPMLTWRMSDFRSRDMAGEFGQVPFFALFDEVRPSTGLAQVVGALCKMGTRGPSLVVCSPDLQGSELRDIQTMLEPLGMDRANILTGTKAKSSRRVLFDNALGVVTATAHEWYPNLVFEAARSAKPLIVVADRGASAELVSEGLTGFRCSNSLETESALASVANARPHAEAMGRRLRTEMLYSVAEGPLSMARTVDRLLS